MNCFEKFKRIISRNVSCLPFNADYKHVFFFRPNVYLHKVEEVETMAILDWVVNYIRKYGVSSKKFLIFVNYVLSTANVYDYLEKGLGDLAFANRVASTNNTIMEMYCSATGPTKIRSEFSTGSNRSMDHSGS